MRNSVAVIVAAGAAALGLSACSSPSSQSSPTTEHPSTTAPVPTTSTTPGPTTQASICTTANLKISLGVGQAGAGNVEAPVLFKNIGSTVCTMTGYPGVAALDTSGNQVAQGQRSPSGYFGGLPQGQTTPSTISLQPGSTASAQIENTDNPTNGATSCPSYPAFLVTPPNDLHSVKVTDANGFPGCSTLQVHPVVSGTTGSVNS